MAVRVERFTQAELPEAVRWQAVSFLRREWPEVFSGAARRAMHPCPPAASPVHFVVRDGDVLVSYAVVSAQRALGCGRELAVAGLGSVFTFPQYRGEGWSTAVVRAASAEVADGPADLGVLFCSPELAAFYAACGWARYEGSTTTGPEEAPLDAGTVTMQLAGPGRPDPSPERLHLPHLW